MSVASNKQRRWRRKLWRIAERRRLAGLPPVDPSRVYFNAKKRRRTHTFGVTVVGF